MGEGGWVAPDNRYFRDLKLENIQLSIYRVVLKARELEQLSGVVDVH
jgi:hypothetical protein